MHPRLQPDVIKLSYFKLADYSDSVENYVTWSWFMLWLHISKGIVNISFLIFFFFLMENVTLHNAAFNLIWDLKVIVLPLGLCSEWNVGMTVCRQVSYSFHPNIWEGFVAVTCNIFSLARLTKRQFG